MFGRLVRDLIEACLAVSAEREATIDALVADMGGPAAMDWGTGSERLARVRAVEHRYSVRSLALLWEWRDVFAAMDQASGERRLVVEQLIDRTHRVVAEQLTAAAAAGTVRTDVDPDLAADMILGIYLQLSRRMLRLTEAPDFSAWATGIDDLLRAGIHPTAPAPPVRQ